MKKILALVLALLILVSVVSCGTTPNGDEVSTDAPTSEASTTVGDTKNEKEPYTGSFKVGYSRVDITPEKLMVGSTMLTKVLNPLYVTCVAVSDGEKTVLIYTADVKNMGTPFCDAARNRIKQAVRTKIGDVSDADIIMGATHNHSAGTPTASSTVDTTVTRWTSQVYSKMVSAANEAIDDLADAEIYVGTAKTTGMAFVRRVFHEDSSFSGIHDRFASKTPAVRYETEADDTLQIIRFVRGEKKDVLVCNWQAHAASQIELYPDSISSDFINYIREDTEKGDDDVLIAYYSGASANVTLAEKVRGTSRYASNPKLVGKAIAKLLIGSKNKLTKVEAGKISSSKWDYDAVYRVYDDDKIYEKAKEINASGAPGSEAYNAALDKYGFKSKYEVEKVLEQERFLSKGKSVKIPLGAISFGDIAFTTIPFEMFDTNGMEIKEGSPYKMTFVLSCAGGGTGYVPSALATKNGGYEVYQTSYKFGTAEEVVAELLEALEKHYNK